MNESLVWGGLGVLLAIGGFGIIAPEFLHELQTHGLGSPITLYGIGVVVAVALTLLIVVPSLIAGE